ncbi:clathrin light chain-domain-containing protein [Phlyctochytrium arcticum]|nr:clathrin light chain-domain-containing protein [Phlyctochytrium arcticum]
MSEFGDFVTTDGGLPMAEDPTADFLAREQAALGADAALFGNSLSTDNFPPTESREAENAFAFAGENNQSELPVFSPNQTADASFAFESTAANEGETGGVYGIDTQENTVNFDHTGVSSVGSAFSPAKRDIEPESDNIRQWREDFNAKIAERDAKLKEKHQATLDAAKEAIERFYAEYNEKKNKSIQKNKEAEKRGTAEREDTASGNIWDRVVRQIETTSQATTSASSKARVDLKQGRPTDDKGKDSKAAKQALKTRDTARMKQLLMSLKKDPKAPGVEASA